MIREWLKEEWQEIKYAHKSVWTSMAVFVLIAWYGSWYAADYSYSGRLKEKDESIAALNAQVQQLQQQLLKLNPKAFQKVVPRNDDSSIIDNIKQGAQDTMYDINTETNRTLNEIDNETSNAVDSIKNAGSSTANSAQRAKQKAQNRVGSAR